MVMLDDGRNFEAGTVYTDALTDLAVASYRDLFRRAAAMIDPIR